MSAPASRSADCSLRTAARPFVSQPEDDHARLVEHAEREHVTEIEIEREHDARVGASARNDVDVWSALQSERSDVHRFVTDLDQKIDGENDLLRKRWRDGPDSRRRERQKAAYRGVPR